MWRYGVDVVEEISMRQLHGVSYSTVLIVFGP